jgi:DNA-binding MarR family transcriptional regulator
LLAGCSASISPAMAQCGSFALTTKLDLAGFVPYQLSIASNAVSDRIARHYRTRFGLKIPEWRLLAVLGQGDPLTQRDLVGATRMDKVTVSRASAALVDRGLIARAASDLDGRSHHLMLTDAGATLYAEIAPAALAMESALLAGLSVSEREILSLLLHRLRDAADSVI